MAAEEIGASFSNLKVSDHDDDNGDILGHMLSFCKEKNIATKGVLAITIQQNRTGEFCSLIIDMDSRTIADMYPVDDLSDYKEGSIRKGATGQFLYCYHANLGPV